MLIKLTGNRYVNSEHIESIDKSQYSASPNANVNWTVRLTSGHYIGLTQVQFEELMLALPTPYDAEHKRTQKQARDAVIARIGIEAWRVMWESEQDDLVSAEVERAASE